LSHFSTSLSSFGILSLNTLNEPVEVGNLNFNAEIDFERIGLEMFDQLNSGQKVAASAILDAVRVNSDERLFFIDGPGGTGKTFLYQTLINIIRGQGK